MKKAYIAGALTAPTPAGVAANIRKAIDAAGFLISAGFAPVIPHMFYFVHIVHFQDYETWMAIDFTLLKSCDIVFRLPGASPGADRECALARELGIMVIDYEQYVSGYDYQ